MVMCGRRVALRLTMKTKPGCCYECNVYPLSTETHSILLHPHETHLLGG